MYSNGQGVQQDYSEAVRWYKLAAAQGEVGAQSNLGIQFFKGQGVLQDYADALRWFKLAAAQGDAIAQFNLGVMYLYGAGVTQDYARAHMWWNLSAAIGNENALKQRDLVVRPEQLIFSYCTAIVCPPR